MTDVKIDSEKLTKNINALREELNALPEPKDVKLDLGMSVGYARLVLNGERNPPLAIEYLKDAYQKNESPLHIAHTALSAAIGCYNEGFLTGAAVGYEIAKRCLKRATALPEEIVVC
jgi:hypothetical protein